MGNVSPKVSAAALSPDAGRACAWARAAKAGANEPERAYGGNPAGFVLIVKDGPTIYHSGDTAYFKDMETIGEQYQIDLALLSIGGHTGMEPRMAARAAQSVRARLVVPQHYGTFPGITENADEFISELVRLRINAYEMKPGETIMYRGKRLILKSEGAVKH